MLAILQKQKRETIAVPNRGKQNGAGSDRRKLFTPRDGLCGDHRWVSEVKVTKPWRLGDGDQWAFGVLDASYWLNAKPSGRCGSQCYGLEWQRDAGGVMRVNVAAQTG